MNYIKYQDKKIRKIASGYQDWYKTKSNVWGERYMKEKEDILTRERTKKEIEIIKKYLPKDCRKILDAPCGYGRISNSLAKLGYKVTGIDISDYFINLARKQAKQKGLSTSYIIGDILKKKIPGRFDVVLNIFTSLGYLEDEKKNESFIKSFANMLNLAVG
jgi:2-polyprenyl-3-methyl-5-hydroxy-6-metoxy-1,4-benzoquinol methylase